MPGTLSAISSFDALFQAVEPSNRVPLRWQSRLYKRFCRNETDNVPGQCTLPTGLGKTSVIPIWLIALASGAILPRRLVYVVNRRTVVDQATEDAEHLRERLSKPRGDEALKALGDALMRIAGEERGEPLAVSTLRGEFADNGEWKRNPARPAIIVGTIDMIGSKLLFSGYGDGRYGRAHHAGLIGQDSLIVHDEAHLSPAFSALLRGVEAEQRRCKEGRPIRVMELSATSRGVGDESEGKERTFGVEDEDRKDAVVKERLRASKRLMLKVVEKAKVADAIASEALEMGKRPRRVLVYVWSPEAAGKIAGTIEKKLGAGGAERVGLLTGTMRGFEREKLARGPLFQAFRSNPTRAALSEAVFLVSTSAGEVGADLDADDLVCDLSTLESMAQRFGRVNRLGGMDANGEKRAAEIVVVRETVAEKGEPKKGRDGKEKKGNPRDAAVALTGAILEKVVAIGGDVSPEAIGAVLGVKEHAGAFSPTPAILPVTDILFDAWSLTSIMGVMPGRPEVAPYLHGVAEWEPPETHVAWRSEISELAKAEVSAEQLEEMLEVFPLRGAEQLKDTTKRVVEQVGKVARRHAERDPAPRVIVIKNGEPRWIELNSLAGDDKAAIDDAVEMLKHATVILPTEVGGLDGGMLNGGKAEPATDVAETTAEGQRNRQRVRIIGEVETGVVGAEVVAGLRERYTVKVGDPQREEEETPRATIEYRVAKAESGEAGGPVLLKEHAKVVANAAAAVGKAVGLSSEITDALMLAGRWHDQGKDRVEWQRYAKNRRYGSATNPAPALAKAKKYGDARTELNGYRHEFGSLMDAAGDGVLKGNPERELILHLIASHHGWGRPHFRHDREPAGASAYDRARNVVECEVAAGDGMRRYAALQGRFGRWGLAWFESLLRAADARGSEGGGA